MFLRRECCYFIVFQERGDNVVRDRQTHNAYATLHNELLCYVKALLNSVTDLHRLGEPLLGEGSQQAPYY